ncbi:calcium-binding mitochondrial carrier protein SCaMC-2 [Dendroctonus ponderosae]
MPRSKDPTKVPPHYFHELPQEDEVRLEKLFIKLDKKGNGRIDVHDLSAALREHGVHQKYAERFLKNSKTTSGDLSLADFIYYVREHEKNLRLHFANLDKNRDGKIDTDELVRAFCDLGIPLDRREATKLLQRMDQDGSLNISYDEWRDFLLLAPSNNIQELINYWRHSTYIDIGEDMNIPDDFTPIEMQTGRWWRHLAAGGVAGAVSRTCTAPLDRLKVFLQVQPSKQRIFDCLQNMLREGGVTGLWRGNAMNVLKIAPETAIKFAAYEQVKRVIKGNSKEALSIYERFFAGAAAGGVSQTIIYPLEVLKTRLALRKTGQYSSIADAAYKIYVGEGVRAYYRGYIPNILGIIPYAGIDLAVYETLKKKYFKTHSSSEQPAFWMLLACGSASSTLGQMCSYPLALIRTRLQAQVIHPSMDPATATMSGVFKTILQKEGVFGLYRGITPNFIKAIPAVSISYVTYEYSSRILGIHMT